jgi:hypothetical protein
MVSVLGVDAVEEPEEPLLELQAAAPATTAEIAARAAARRDKDTG